MADDKLDIVKLDGVPLVIAAVPAVKANNAGAAAVIFPVNSWLC